MSEPRPIRPLPDHVINQIAAGEVIERPASVVKELVENSLDAGARRILVELSEGGLQTIRVTDDGYGIPGSELPHAVTRHYTSKLSRAEDLAAIATLGFRGEALASIASVARISVTSAIANAASGYRLDATPSQPREVHPAAHPVGTTIEISELFFNTPPRRRFLKRPRTEFLLIQQLLRQIAFTQPALDLELRHDGDRVFRLIPAALIADKVRIGALLGRSFLRQAVAIDTTFDDIHVVGWVGLAGAARSLRDQQYLSVNGRVISDRRLGHALRLAFADEIPAGRHPCYALAIELPLDQVDVNVHPCKAEVRFQEPRLVHDALYLAASRALRAKEAATEPPESVEREVQESRLWPGYQGNAFDLMTTLPNKSNAAMRHERILYVVARRWLVTNDRNRLFVIDGKLLIEGIVRSRLRQDPDGSRRRPLLLPVPLSECDPLLAHARELESLGFGLRHGALHEVPVCLPEFDAAMFVNTLRTAPASDLSGTIARSVAAGWVAPTQSEMVATLLAEFATIAPLSACAVELDTAACEELFTSAKVARDG
ncbi:MAG: DNA mismatch repair endonuclease MutL [Gammaproteobacteria bacterium]|nr:DNA mismatch repair endonuclease MutL [Gammaproteobacteria bacterium]